MPLKIDDSTLFDNFGDYARVLIDVDLAIPPPKSIMLKREGSFIFTFKFYENMPDFYVACSSIGYATSKYCSLNKDPKDKDEL